MLYKNIWSTNYRLLVLWFGMASLLLAVAVPSAKAHIDINQGGTHMSRTPGSGIKTAPCGVAGSQRGTNVYTYRPGATINISVKETISHPGYFRISFDDSGDDDFTIPSGTSGEFGNCGSNPNCGEGKEDYCNHDTVLLDNLDPHPQMLPEQPTYTWSVTLPNVECENCTLQIIQMMNDFVQILDAHSEANYPDADIYYHCIDITLSNDAPEVNDPVMKNNGIDCKAEATGEAGDTTEAPATPDTMTPTDEPTAMMPTDPVTTAGVPDTGAMSPDPAAMMPSPPMAGAPTPTTTPTPTTPPTGMTAAMNPTATAGVPGTATPPVMTADPLTMAPAAPTATSAPTTTGAPTATSDSGGCHVSTAGGSTWAPIGILLFALGLRRRRNRPS